MPELHHNTKNGLKNKFWCRNIAEFINNSTAYNDILDIATRRLVTIRFCMASIKKRTAYNNVICHGIEYNNIIWTQKHSITSDEWLSCFSNHSTKTSFSYLTNQPTNEFGEGQL